LIYIALIILGMLVSGLVLLVSAPILLVSALQMLVETSIFKKWLVGLLVVLVGILGCGRLKKKTL